MIVQSAISTTGLIGKALSFEMSQIPRSAMIQWRQGKQAVFPLGLPGVLQRCWDINEGGNSRQESSIENAQYSLLNTLYKASGPLQLSRHIVGIGLMLCGHVSQIEVKDHALEFIDSSIAEIRTGDGIDIITVAQAWETVAVNINEFPWANEDSLGDSFLTLMNKSLKQGTAHCVVNVFALFCALSAEGAMTRAWKELCVKLCLNIIDTDLKSMRAISPQHICNTQVSPALTTLHQQITTRK